jgi:hypothetical protein
MANPGGRTRKPTARLTNKENAADVSSALVKAAPRREALRKLEDRNGALQSALEVMQGTSLRNSAYGRLSDSYSAKLARVEAEMDAAKKKSETRPLVQITRPSGSVTKLKQGGYRLIKAMRMEKHRAEYKRMQVRTLLLANRLGTHFAAGCCAQLVPASWAGLHEGIPRAASPEARQHLQAGMNIAVHSLSVLTLGAGPRQNTSIRPV